MDPVTHEAPPTRMRTLGLPVTLGLLGASLVAAVVMAYAGVPIVSTADLPLLGVLTAAMAAVRWAGARTAISERAVTALFWLNLVLAAAAIWLSPAFGLYLFVGYYESGRFTARSTRVAGIVATALVIALAQVGGPRSLLFTPLVYAAFAAVNLAVTLLMLGLDRQRERLFVTLARTNDDLRAEQERSAALRDQLVAQAREAGIAEERSRVSREIHDTVAQDLVAIIAQLDAASDETDASARDRRLATVSTTARAALAEARRAVRALASPRLDAADLPLALDDLLGSWRTASGLDGELRVKGVAAATGRDDALLRIVQEALANAARHARASRADVALTYGDGVRVEVADDGVGFDTDAVTRGFGLIGMRDRMASVGGWLEVASAPGEGTRVIAWVPGGREHA